MTKQKIILFILLTLSFNSISQASITPFDFLKYSSSARSAALSGAVVTTENDASTIFYNPAATFSVEDKALSVTFLKHVLDINSGNAVYSIPELFDDGKTAVSVAFNDYGSFENANNRGEKSGSSFGGRDLSLGFSYSNLLDSNFTYGVTAKLLFVSLEEQSTSALAFDAGLLYKMKDGRTNLGVSVLNIGTQLSKIGNESDPLPLDMRLGISHRLQGLPLLVNLNFHHLTDEGNIGKKLKSFSIGGEFYFGKLIQVRLGYDNLVRNNLTVTTQKGFSGMSAGVGLKFESFTLDYGAALYGSAASTHRFSLGLDV